MALEFSAKYYVFKYEFFELREYKLSDIPYAFMSPSTYGEILAKLVVTVKGDQDNVEVIETCKEDWYPAEHIYTRKYYVNIHGETTFTAKVRHHENEISEAERDVYGSKIQRRWILEIKFRWTENSEVKEKTFTVRFNTKWEKDFKEVYVVCGKVLSSVTEKPIQGASVDVRSDHSIEVLTTDEDGFFKIILTTSGPINIVAWADGYEENALYVEELSLGRNEFTIYLDPEEEKRKKEEEEKEREKEERKKIWYVVVGDGLYFCKTHNKSTAEKALEYYEKNWPEVSWKIKEGTIDDLGALPTTNCEEEAEKLEEEKEEKEEEKEEEEMKKELWYVVVGDGAYFCKSKDKSKAEDALDYYKNRYPDIHWEIKEGTTDELGALPSTDCSEVLEEKEKEEPLLEGFITLAENPTYGKLVYNPETKTYVFYDYQKQQTRIPTEWDFTVLGIENPADWMKDVDTVCTTCMENKTVAGLTDEEINEMVKAAARGQVLPISAVEFATAVTGLFGLARMALQKLVGAGAVKVVEWTYTTAEGSGTAAATAMENAAKALGGLGIIDAWSTISKYLGVAKDAFFTSLWIGGFTPFICEEATQAAGMAIFIARQVKDSDLLKDAIDRYEQIVTTGKELTEKFGILNPFTYDAFKLFFQAAMDSLEIYRKLPDKIKKENEEREKEKEEWAKYREERKKFHEDFMKYWEERKKSWEDFMDYWEERKRSWEAFMERDVEKTLSIMINTVTDSLRAIYFGMRTGVETISLLKRLLKQITEETARARIEKMIEEAQKRIQDISANYEEIVQRGLEYASQVQDDTARASYESYILTLREQIEMELMRAEAEEIPIVEGIFKKGYLYVMGYPRYCRIYLNGEDTGKLAPERFVLDPGKYELKVVRETGEEWVKEVEVKEGETTEVIYYIPRKEA